VIHTGYLLLFTYWNRWAHCRLDIELEWEIQGICAYVWCVNPPGKQPFGRPGNEGKIILTWILENYAVSSDG